MSAFEVIFFFFVPLRKKKKKKKKKFFFFGSAYCRLPIPQMPLVIRDAVSVRPVVGRVTGPSWPVMRGQDGFHADVWSQTGSALGSRTTTAVCVDRRRA